MSRAFPLAVLLAILSPFFPASSAVAGSHPTLLAVPSEGHAGSTMYLSGSGFPRRAKLTLRIACSHARPSVWSGPSADAHGQFVAYATKAPSLHGRQSVRCALTARAGRGAAASAGYTLLPGSRSLSPCATRICLKLTAVLVKVRHGVQGNVVVKGWPGAEATVVVSAPAQRPMQRRVRLPWHGSAAARFPLASSLKQGLRARVSVSARLGNASGSASTHFSVLPGIR